MTWARYLTQHSLSLGLRSLQAASPISCTMQHTCENLQHRSTTRSFQNFGRRIQPTAVRRIAKKSSLVISRTCLCLLRHVKPQNGFRSCKAGSQHGSIYGNRRFGVKTVRCFYALQPHHGAISACTQFAAKKR